jgi:predicted secreted protein
MRSGYLYPILVFAVCLVLPSYAFQPGEEWNKTYGGPYSDGVWAVQPTKDGNYILAGFTGLYGQRSDLWLLKVDKSGNELWSKVLGGAGEDIGYAVQESQDGGFILAGSTDSYGIGKERFWLLKVDANGSILWDRVFGGFVSSSGDGAWSTIETSDSGVAAVGYTQSLGAGEKDLWLIKADSAGNKIWDHVFGGSKDDVGMSLVQTHDQGYVITGRTKSFGSGGDDIWLLKVDARGKEQWNETFGGQNDDVGLQVLELEDGYVITGRTESFGAKKAFLLKVGLRGQKVWERTYGENTAGISVQSAPDQGFIIAGRSDTTKRGREALIIKTDSDGNKEWMMTLGGPDDDIATYVAISGTNYVLAGITNSFGAGNEDAWLTMLGNSNPGGPLASRFEVPEDLKFASLNKSIRESLPKTMDEIMYR